ncbi:hypothetical protein Tco_1500217 [Tanacetum coccineum]
MGEPLSLDHVFDFPMDEPEPHPAYDFFAPGLLPGYAGNPNNNNGWVKADIEEQVIALVIDMKEDIAMLLDDGDFSDDDSEGFEDKEEVWEVNEEWLMAFVTPPLMLVVPPSSNYEVGGPSAAAAKGQSFPIPAPEQPLVKKVIQVSDAEVADGITIEEIGPRVSVVEGQGQQIATQRDEVITRLTQWVQALQAAVQQRDSHIHQLQTMVTEMSNCESTLMQCILGMDRRLADLVKRPPGPQ